MNEVTKPRVLLVDDDASLLKLLAIRIESKGYLVSTVESGIEALQTLKNQTYDAVITDLRMDEMDGMALHRQLQSRYPSMPVIMMTAHGSIPDAVEATKQGIFAFITKPLIKMSCSTALLKLSRSMVYMVMKHRHKQILSPVAARCCIYLSKLNCLVQRK